MSISCKNVLKTREMLIMLQVLVLLTKNVLKTREMLNMLKVLGVSRPRWTPNTQDF